MWIRDGKAKEKSGKVDQSFEVSIVVFITNLGVSVAE
jgi:hypothetical protein